MAAATATRQDPKNGVTEEVAGVKKAAILMVSLDKGVAAGLLKGLMREQVEDITREVATLGEVDGELRQSIVAEFHQLLVARTYVQKGGLTYAKQLLEQTLSPEEATQILSQIERLIYERPFSFLQRTDSDNLLTFIQEEHPQTIALILSHLDPHKASGVLVRLSPQRQVEVIRRICKMEQTSPEVVKEIEKGLEQRLSGIVTERMQKVGGVECVAEILNFADRTTEKGIFTGLEEQDAELVEQIRRLMFVFEDILLINDKGVQSALKDLETSDLVLALRTASDELKQKIFRNMSERAAQLVKEEMEYLGPVRLSDVEAAQRKIVDVIRRLEDAGEIVVSGRGDKDLVV